MMLNDDGFTLSEMTAAINELPHLPTMLGDDGVFEYGGVSTLTVQVEKQGQTLALVSSKPRGAPGPEVGRLNRNLRPFNLVHLPLDDRILADEVQGVPVRHGRHADPARDAAQRGDAAGHAPLRPDDGVPSGRRPEGHRPRRGRLHRAA